MTTVRLFAQVVFQTKNCNVVEMGGMQEHKLSVCIFQANTIIIDIIHNVQQVKIQAGRVTRGISIIISRRTTAGQDMKHRTQKYGKQG